MDTLVATQGGDALKVLKTNLVSWLLSRDVVELLDAVEEELAVEVEFTGPAQGPSIYSTNSIVSSAL